MNILTALVVDASIRLHVGLTRYETTVSDLFRTSNVMRRTGCAAGGTAALTRLVHDLLEFACIFN